MVPHSGRGNFQIKSLKAVKMLNDNQRSREVEGMLKIAAHKCAAAESWQANTALLCRDRAVRKLHALIP